MAGAVWVAGVGSVGGCVDCDAGGVVGFDSCEGGTEEWVAFKVAKELGLVVAVRDGRGFIFGVEMNNFFAAVIA